MLAQRNYDEAVYRKIGNRYLIEVTGKRLAASHNLQHWGTYEDYYQFDVPRIEGAIDGREIHQRSGFYPFVGSITIHGGTMTVDLSLDNYDFHRQEKLDWNDTYTLAKDKTESLGGSKKRELFGPYAAVESIHRTDGSSSRAALGGPPPSYPDDMRKQGITGFVIVRISSEAGERVKSATLVQSSRKEFEEVALRAARQWLLRGEVGGFEADCRIKFSFLELDESLLAKEQLPEPMH